MIEIVHFEEVIQDYLGDDLEFLDYTTTALNTPGENYNSVMLNVEIRVKNRKTNVEEIIYAVAKTPPPLKPEADHHQKIIQSSFTNEIGFYRDVFPELIKIQQENGLETVRYFPEFLAGRLNSDGSEESDGNAVIILENLTKKNFIVESRYVGFNEETTKLILRDLANMHATALAIKIKNQDIFDQKIKPYLTTFEGHKPPTEMIKTMKDGIIKTIQDNILQKELLPKIELIVKNTSPLEVEGSELFSTICHNDLWVNNTLVKYENQIPVENKFVDFQMCRYNSGPADLIFFLLTSVEDEVVKKNFDSFIEIYYNEFITILEKLGCDVTPYNWEAFQKELRTVKNTQFCHAVGMLTPIFLEKSKAVDLKDLKFEDLIKGKPSKRHVEKFHMIVDIYIKKGWFN